MKWLRSGPMLLLYCIGAMAIAHRWLSCYNSIAFPWNLTGILISWAGFEIMEKARRSLKKYNTSTGYEAPTALVTEGIYNNTRNPIYLGMIILLLGLAVVFQNFLSVLIPASLFFYLHFTEIPKEEEQMEELFGDRYLEYRNQVRRWI